DTVCAVCGETVAAGEAIAATGHTTEVRNAKAATCTEDGYTGDTICTVCGETVAAGEAIAATGHTTGIQNAKAATCAEDGYTGDTVCTVCGEIVAAGEAIAATGHTTEIQNAKAATCTEDGYTGDTVCTVCGETITAGEAIAATGHSYRATEVVAPTYAAQGYTVYTCSDCGSSYRADYTAILVVEGTDTVVDTRQLIQSLTIVPEELAQLYTSVEALQTELINRVTVGEGYIKENTAVYDVTMQYLSNGAWVNATEGDFPLTGITVTLPYPEGTDSSYDFVVVHMFSVTSERLGIKAGDTESPAVTKTEDGLVVTLNGLSPVAVSWTRSAVTTTGTGNETSPDTGDNSRLALWIGLMCIGGLGIAIAAVTCSRRRRNNK
ncbi:MAG: hypothetical protein LUH58_09180, partial [Lachnospiraceae bacterium]|nr:hypothetical protein [Lachnospiraceae bacterium]